MTEDNIIPMPTPMNVLAQRYRDAFARSEKSHADWIAATLDMAATLHEARERHSSNTAFRIWLAENELNFHNGDDQAALINMHEYRAITEIVLQETVRISPQHIWRNEIQPRLRYVTKTTTSVPSMPEPPQQAASEPKSADLPIDRPANPPVATEPPIEPSAKPSTEPTAKPQDISARSGYAKAPRANEVHALFQSRHARAVLSKLWRERGGATAWALILPAIDEGFVTINNMAPDAPTLALLFPRGPVSFVRRFKLDNQHTRSLISNTLLPKMIACKTELLAEPERI